METTKTLKAAKARQQVYEQSERSCPTTKGDCLDEEINELLLCVSVKKGQEVKPQTSQLQHCSQPQSAAQIKQEDKHEDGIAALIRVLAESIGASRIPLPEPAVFIGDPLRFNDWKVSFQTLVDRKNIPAEEKIYYLRKYVGGSAKGAIESYFLLSTESAYYAAWQILE